MTNNPTWKQLNAFRENASFQGESLIEDLDIQHAPIDPLITISDDPSIYTKGVDLGEALDGRLSYARAKKPGQKSRFVLAYNTRYNQIYKYEGSHHPKVRFTIAHELGHFFINYHRNQLLGQGCPYSCLTETWSSRVMELEADAFAAGLLMPGKLLSPIINRDVAESVNLDTIRDIASQFQVSLTSMMVRWVRLSHFPCAVFSVAYDKGQLGIRWGWVSEAFASIGAYYRWYGKFHSKNARKFLGANPDFSKFRIGTGLGSMNDWVNTELHIAVSEYYAIIPYAQHLLVFITAPEDELEQLL